MIFPYQVLCAKLSGKIYFMWFMQIIGNQSYIYHYMETHFHVAMHVWS